MRRAHEIAEIDGLGDALDANGEIAARRRKGGFTGPLCHKPGKGKRGLGGAAKQGFPRHSCAAKWLRDVASKGAWSAQGKSAWEIGEILCVAKRTVDEHAQSAMRKAVNRTQAVAIAIRHRLFEV